MKIYIMIGCPGSGKSTLIKRNLVEDFPVVSRDIIREELGMCGVGVAAEFVAHSGHFSTL